MVQGMVEVLEPLKVVMGKVVAAAVVEDMVVETEDMVEEVGLAMVPDMAKVAEITPEAMEKVVATAEGKDKVVKMALVGAEAMDKVDKEVLAATKLLVPP
jgi:hypothetical protein